MNAAFFCSGVGSLYFEMVSGSLPAAARRAHHSDGHVIRDAGVDRLLRSLWCRGLRNHAPIVGLDDMNDGIEPCPAMTDGDCGGWGATSCGA